MTVLDSSERMATWIFQAEIIRLLCNTNDAQFVSHNLWLVCGFSSGHIAIRLT